VKPRPKQTTLFCFSPMVMVTTFLVEISLAAYVLIRYRMSRLTRLVSTLLLCLATFQLAEYFVCGGLGINAVMWSEIGYVAITLLPPLGVHLTQTIAGKPAGYVSALAYSSAALWIGLFAFGNVFNGHVCGGNYVIFQLKHSLGSLFFVYYHIWLFVAMYLASRYAKTANPSVAKALKAQIAGYATFIVPSSLINLLWPYTSHGLPSIMCGFAVIFAIVLVAYVIPVEKERTISIRQKIRL
jgi:hypothetical protein